MAVLAALLGSVAIVGARADSQSSTKQQSVAYQIDPAHDGQAQVRHLNPPFKQVWSVDLGAPVSYPLIADGRVFVTVANSEGYGTQLYALDRVSGAKLWHKAISGTYLWSNAAYENGQVFVVNFDGLLKAFDAATGNLDWSVQLPGQYAFSAPPTASGGQVFVGGAGSGGTLYAVDESNGHVNWTNAVENGDESSPAVGGGGVYVSYPCQVYSFAPITGQQRWHYSGNCEGGGGKTAVYSSKRLFSRDSGNNLIFDSKTGNVVGPFSALTAPAVFKDASRTLIEVALWNGVLSAINVATGEVLWTFKGDNSLVTAPLVINGNVIEGANSGNLYALDGDTGSVLWSTDVGSSIPGPDEQNVSQPLTGLGAGERTLVVPAGNIVYAFKGK